MRSATSERRQRLLELVSGDEPNEIPELAMALKVSESTVRRDLADLEAEGLILRVIGGAVARPADPSWRQKDRVNAAAKRRIGQAAAAQVEPGMLVFLDAGTTVAKAAEVLAGCADITLATTSLPSLMVLAEGAAEVVVLGGVLHPRGGRLLGSMASQQLARMTPDVAFLGADSIDLVRGLSCPDMELQAMKSLTLENARTTWVLLDNTKLTARHRHPYFVPLPTSVGLITEAPVTASAREAIEAWRAAGHRVIEAD
ncbi:MAG: DeoR/GlpR family DNA-binding transcription regulator [Propioniciclava sp.]|uniref:DeoR/GlpR family DNA-binding transcription regulator n=1 Tax=Propioniciclava sp. TaxID=2038686 RepID=UPI0039E3FC34